MSATHLLSRTGSWLDENDDECPSHSFLDGILAEYCKAKSMRVCIHKFKWVCEHAETGYDLDEVLSGMCDHAAFGRYSLCNHPKHCMKFYLACAIKVLSLSNSLHNLPALRKILQIPQNSCHTVVSSWNCKEKFAFASSQSTRT